MSSSHAVPPSLSVRGLRFRYRGRPEWALDGVDLEVEGGQFVVVLGASGAGKSTLSLALNGLIPHFVKGRMEGEVHVLGNLTSTRTVAELAGDVGLVFQDFEAQLFATNVELEVAFGLENFGVPREVMLERVAKALAMVELTGLERREPANLSGGQKQRLAIAAVLALHPRVIVMDEPTTDLDPGGTAEVVEVARRLRLEGRTLIMVEHEVEEVVSADRIIVLDEGRLVASGPPEEVLTRTDWLETRGIQPPGAAQVMSELGEEPVLDPDVAAERLRARGYTVPDHRWDELLSADEGRAYGDPVLEVDGVGFRYPNGVRALDGVDLTIRAGELVGIVGANGSGKTTLIKHLNGLLDPSEGEIRVQGRPARGQGVKRLGLTVGYVFQNPDHQIFAESVQDEVSFALRNHGMEEAEVEVRVREAVEAVGLRGQEDEDPFTMTKGERQRVAVASVLATRPRVIVLDEPTTGLDYRQQRLMMELVTGLNQAGHTIVCVTHAMWVVAEFCHRTVVLAEGRIIADGPSREVFARAELLARARLRAPQVVRITTELGRTLLSVEEVRRNLVREA